MATSGPGATNLVTGIATAMLDGSPIVCITGQVSSGLLGLDAFQEVDITGITMPITKHNYLVTDASRIAPTLVEAFEIAMSGRPGPVLVDITKDAQQAACSEYQWDGPALDSDQARSRLPEPGRAEALLNGSHLIDSSACVAALDAIASARRPVILAGHGVLIAGASRLLQDFAERASIPVATTLLGIGAMPASHPLNLGMLGMHGEAFVNEAVQGADLIIAIGMRFDDRAVGRVSDFAPAARRIHIDIDRAEINKTVRADIAIVGDAAEVVAVLLRDLPAFERQDWLARIHAARRTASARDILNLPDDGGLHAAHVMHDLWRETRGRAVVVTDVGQHQMWEAQYHPHEKPRSLITSGGLGTMGFGLPAAIGVEAGEAGRGGVGRRGRRRLPDDEPRTGDAGRAAPAVADRGHQQWLPGHGASVAGTVLRKALCRDADGRARLLQAGRGVRPRRLPRHRSRRASRRRCARHGASRVPR